MHLETIVFFNGNDTNKLVFLETEWQQQDGEIGYSMSRVFLTLENSKIQVVTTGHAWESSAEGQFLGDNTSCTYEKVPSK